MTISDERQYAETIVAAALLKAFSAEIGPESRIMLGRYSRQIAFRNRNVRLIQTAFDLNISPEAVENPDLVAETAQLMGVDPDYLDSLYSVHILSEELYHAIVFLTGAVFDYGEIVEQVALRDGD